MKARASMTIALVLACILLALPAPVLATSPEPLTIEAELWMTGENSAAGTFETSGLFADSVAAYLRLPDYLGWFIFIGALIGAILAADARGMSRGPR